MNWKKWYPYTEKHYDGTKCVNCGSKDTREAGYDPVGDLPLAICENCGTKFEVVKWECDVYEGFKD